MQYLAKNKISFREQEKMNDACKLKLTDRHSKPNNYA